MKTFWLLASIVVAMILVGLVYQCAATLPVRQEYYEPVAAVQETITLETGCLVVFYTNTISVTLPYGMETYPLTMTYEIRPGGHPTVTLARQVFTYTVEAAEEYTDEPVITPTLTCPIVWHLPWDLMPPGPIEVFAKGEIPGYTMFIPDQGHDGNGYYVIWTGWWGYRVYMPIMGVKYRP